MAEIFVDEVNFELDDPSLLLAIVEDCMDRALDAFPDSAKIDVLWAGMKNLRERLRGEHGRTKRD